MKKILAFAGSNSSMSINHQLIVSVAEIIDFAKVDVIRLRDFEVPIFGIDAERETGIPKQMHELKNIISDYDGFIISTPEHNGIPPAFLLNILDWMSRINRRIFNEKPMLLLSTSDGARAGISALTILQNTIHRFGANVAGSYAFPSFFDNFSDAKITNIEELEKLKNQLNVFQEKIYNLETKE